MSTPIAPDWAKFVQQLEYYADQAKTSVIPPAVYTVNAVKQALQESTRGHWATTPPSADQLCDCDCATKCPLGKTGSAARCTMKELEEAKSRSAPSGESRGRQVAFDTIVAGILIHGTIDVCWYEKGMQPYVIRRWHHVHDVPVQQEYLRSALARLIDAEIARAKKAQWEESEERERSIRGEINRAKVVAGGNPDRDLAELVEEAIARAKLEQGDGSSEVLDQIRKVVRAGPHEHLPAAVANAIAKAAAIAREGRLRNPEPTAKATESSPPEPDLTIAGVALDTAVADKVMSWDVTNVRCGGWAEKPNGIMVSIARRDWSPSTKIRDAMEVWEKVRGKVGIDRTAQIFESENIPLAICRAALEVVGAEVRK